MAVAVSDRSCCRSRRCCGSRALGSREHNLVVVHLSQGGSFVREGALLRAARLLGFRTVAHLHGSNFVAYAASKPDRVRRVLRAASRVYVLSAATAETVLRFVPADRVELVANAVPTGGAGPKRRRVVFGGSVSRRKGVDVLVSAWSQLDQTPTAGRSTSSGRQSMSSSRTSCRGSPFMARCRMAS